MEFTLQLGNHCALWDKLKFGCEWSHRDETIDYGTQSKPAYFIAFSGLLSTWAHWERMESKLTVSGRLCDLWSNMLSVESTLMVGPCQFRCACTAHTKLIQLIYISLKLQLTTQALITVPWEADRNLETSAWSNKIAQEETWKKRDRCQAVCEEMPQWDVRKPTFIPFWLFHEGFGLQLMGWKVMDPLMLEALSAHFIYKKLNLSLDLNV